VAFGEIRPVGHGGILAYCVTTRGLESCEIARLRL
jgi:hypothetical protein